MFHVLIGVLCSDRFLNSYSNGINCKSKVHNIFKTIFDAVSKIRKCLSSLFLSLYDKGRNQPPIRDEGSRVWIESDGFTKVKLLFRNVEYLGTK